MIFAWIFIETACYQGYGGENFAYPPARLVDFKYVVSYLNSFSNMMISIDLMYSIICDIFFFFLSLVLLLCI